MSGITHEQQVLFLLLGNALFLRGDKIPDDVDWNVVLREARQQAVLPLAWEAAKGCLSGPAAEAIDRQVGEIVVNDMYIDFDHVELHSCMQAAGIPYVVMKGSASAAYYPQPMLRMMGDVDFLVHREDVQRAGEALLAQGFQAREGQDETIHRAYTRNNDPTHSSEWELHWRPNGIPSNATGEKIWELLSDSVETACLHETENGCYMVPDDFHHGLMLLVHTAMHLMHSGVGLRHLCDWAVFSDSLPTERFCALFEGPLQEVGLWGFASALTACAARYLGCCAPRWAELVPEELLEALMLDILAGGNFGKKDRGRLDQARFLVDREQGVVGKNVGGKNLLSALSVKARRSLPFLERAPFLLPVGWAWVSVRHLLRIARGKRPAIRLDETLGAAEKRSELYKQLRLFEPWEG
ncbi:MAG: nucleotidyltransferase family protein [Oscillospiraceae bacterium]|nr:nucleotidyltransferase family protein [Oscillospiraceae bacterium]